MNLLHTQVGPHKADYADFSLGQLILERATPMMDCTFIGDVGASKLWYGTWQT